MNSASQPSFVRRISRDTWLALGLIVLLALITAAAGVQQTVRQRIPPLASHSVRADGSHALKEWLDALGYTTLASSTDSEIPEQARLALILEPRIGISASEWTGIDEWVEEGGVLIVVGEGSAASYAMQHFGFGLRYLSEPAEELTVQTPWLASPPLESPVSANANYYLYPSNGQNNDQEETGHVVHLATKGSAVLISLRRGEGRVILSSATFPFTNAGLKAAGNPELLLNLLALAPPPGMAWFDEWHHGVRTMQRQVIGPAEWLRYTPGGQSLLAAVALILIALFLQGQRFGRPASPVVETRRRGPLEYITALANLSRRAGHRRAVLEQLYFQLKRELGQRYRIDPTLSDGEYLSALAQARPNLDVRALQKLFAQLKNQRVSEKEMIQLARQAANWLNYRKEKPA